MQALLCRPGTPPSTRIPPSTSPCSLLTHTEQQCVALGQGICVASCRGSHQSIAAAGPTQAHRATHARAAAASPRMSDSRMPAEVGRVAAAEGVCAIGADGGPTGRASALERSCPNKPGCRAADSRNARSIPRSADSHRNHRRAGLRVTRKAGRHPQTIARPLPTPAAHLVRRGVRALCRRYERNYWEPWKARQAQCALLEGLRRAGVRLVTSVRAASLSLSSTQQPCRLGWPRLVLRVAMIRNEGRSCELGQDLHGRPRPAVHLAPARAAPSPPASALLRVLCYRVRGVVVSCEGSRVVS